MATTTPQALAITTSTTLSPHKSSLLSACLSANSLTFGTYTLKSGRQSPYFFNAGSLHTGKLLRTLSHAFAVTIADNFGPSKQAQPLQNGQEPESSAAIWEGTAIAADTVGATQGSRDCGFDVVFGPAYKGIPLCASIVVALAGVDDAKYGDISYTFDRKTAKTYGDGGRVVGAPLKGKRVLIVDDVITAGTAIREAMNIIKEQGGTVVGIVVALDRQERAPSAKERGETGAAEGEEETMSAIGQVRKEFDIPVTAVLTLDDIIEGYKAIGNDEDIRRLEEYRTRYTASD